MESRNGRSWFTRVGVATLFIVLSAVSSCDIEDPAGVGSRDVPALHKGSVKVDSAGNSTDDNCYWVNGQWICSD